MKKEPCWIALSAVLAMHEELLAEHGGAAGIRDQGLLDSALNRPRHLWQYESPDLADLAAAYAHGVARNHPFVDGNKRTAFLTAYTFLVLNGQDLESSEADVVHMTLGLASGAISQGQYAAWLRTVCAA